MRLIEGVFKAFFIIEIPPDLLVDITRLTLFSSLSSSS